MLSSISYLINRNLIVSVHHLDYVMFGMLFKIVNGVTSDISYLALDLSGVH